MTLPGALTACLIGLAIAGVTACSAQSAAQSKGVAQACSAADQNDAQVEVRVAATVTRDGEVVDVAIDRSSGNKNLDESALSAVREARFKPVPATTKGDRVKFIAPICFVLKK